MNRSVSDGDNPKEEGMLDRVDRGRVRLAGLALVVSAALVLVAGAMGGSRAAACGEVVLNENSWVGSTANVYVLKNVLESKLKCKVKVLKVNTVRVKGKKRRLGRYQGFTSSRKKAVVSLKDGDSIKVFEGV